MIACICASLPQKATVTPQVGSRHCHTCSPFPGATKNSTSMQRGPDCLSGSKATQNASASTRSPIGGSDKPAGAATIFNYNGARPAQLGCLGRQARHRCGPRLARASVFHPGNLENDLIKMSLIARARQPTADLISNA